jgi:hypothetical protein
MNRTPREYAEERGEEIRRLRFCLEKVQEFFRNGKIYHGGSRTTHRHMDDYVSSVLLKCTGSSDGHNWQYHVPSNSMICLHCTQVRSIQSR